MVQCIYGPKRCSAVQVLWRSHYFSWIDLLAHRCHGGHYQIHCSSTILNQTLTILKNAFSFSSLEKIMSKRRAVETLDLVPVMKKIHPAEMASDLKKSVDTNNSADNKIADFLPSMSSASPAVHHTVTTSLSSAKCLEDSGIEVTPVVGRSLARVPGMPGFLLNPPKICSPPKFDFPASNTDNCLPCEKDVSSISTEVKCMSKSPQNVLEKKDCESKNNCAAVSDISSTDSHSCESTVGTGKLIPDVAVDRSKITNVSVAANSDVSSRTMNRVETKANTSDITKIRVSSSPAKCNDNADNVLQSNEISTSSTEDDNAQSSKEQQSKEKVTKQVTPIQKPLKTKPKQPVGAIEHKKLETRTSKGSEQPKLKTKPKEPIVVTEHKKLETQTSIGSEQPTLKTKPKQSATEHKKLETQTSIGSEQPTLKTKPKQPVVAREHKKPETETSKSSKRLTSTSDGREAHVASGMQEQAHQEKQVSSQSHPKTRKRQSAERNDGQAELSVSSANRSKNTVKKEQEKHNKSVDKSENIDSKKRKKTVLPASLLKDVVKTVQENVGTISMQLVAASTESSAHIAPTLATCSKTDSSAPSTKSVSKIENSQSDKHVGSSSAGENANQNNSEKSKAENESALKTANQDTAETKTKPEKSESVMEIANQDSGKTEQSPEHEASSTPSKQSLHDSADHPSVANSQDLETDLCSNLPVECVETQKSSSGEIQEAKKKARNKKKQSKRQRKSTEGDGENLFGVLPEYIPDSDSRLRKKKEDKVYNLSALFSGQLLNRQPSPKRSRPNYFFAIQITNPEIKTGFSSVLQEVEEACPKLKAAFVGVESAHLTLGVMHLPDEEAVARVISLMEDFRVIDQSQKLQERLALEEQEQEPEQTAQEKTASVDLSPAQGSAKTSPASVPAKSDAADPLKTPDSDSAKTATSPSEPLVTVSTDSVNTVADSVHSSTADPWDTGSAKSADTQTTSPVNIDSTDPGSVEATDPVKTNTTSPGNSEPVSPAKDDCAKDHTADLTETDLAIVEKSDGVDRGKAGSALTLEVKGLDTFGDNVVFAKVMEGVALDQVKAMAEQLKSQVISQNISMDSRPFAPHVTLMKMSKNPGKLRASGIRKIDSKLYQEFKETHFGSNTVTSIQLCAMMKPKQNNYYHIEHEIPLS